MRCNRIPSLLELSVILKYTSSHKCLKTQINRSELSFEMSSDYSSIQDLIRVLNDINICQLFNYLSLERKLSALFSWLTNISFVGRLRDNIFRNKFSEFVRRLDCVKYHTLDKSKVRLFQITSTQQNFIIYMPQILSEKICQPFKCIMPTNDTRTMYLIRRLFYQ